MCAISRKITPIIYIYENMIYYIICFMHRDLHNLLPFFKHYIYIISLKGYSNF